MHIVLHYTIYFIWRIQTYESSPTLNKRFAVKCYVRAHGPNNTWVLQKNAGTFYNDNGFCEISIVVSR